MKRPSPLNLGALLIGGLLGTALLMNTSGPSTRKNPADVTFLRDMSAHHAQAVEMSVTLLKRSSDPDVKLLAQDITLTQQAQIGQMSGWLTAWGLPVAGVNPPMHGMDRAAMGMASQNEVRSLDTLPVREAEAQFLLLMREHHLGGVRMAQSVLNTGQEPLVRSFAQRVVSSQSAEIRTIDALLKERSITPSTTPSTTPDHSEPDNSEMENMDHG